MNFPTSTPSLFDDGQIGTGSNIPNTSTTLATSSLVDLLYDGFYIIFLLKRQHLPSNPEDFRKKILEFLSRFEQQAKKLQFSSEDISDAKYAFCALLDETIVTQQDECFFGLQNTWLINPLQLSLFGSQLAGYNFFEILEQLRTKGKVRLAALEVFHYCLLLGLQGKYRIQSAESLNHLITRLGDEIDYLKGKKNDFSPFAALPDQIKNIIHKELPFTWILLILLLFTVVSFTGLNLMLNKQNIQALSQYQDVISIPAEQANITVYLP
ncbi:type IVB secretion system protein IcmH/DotU [Acinetobacter boissieri]|uniref:Type VI secretion system protein ImpK n=1 Tax=Acinetobacter boissieri TaxID=1219383 RepID=A0A1G6IKS1_9GAMM|nr:type IVB secretion system protein IcmH/DotU [Acinetobacter boissieri]SDC06605.1 type VI secretion system protein ImpK [Acinetobacter boissieri]